MGEGVAVGVNHIAPVALCCSVLEGVIVLEDETLEGHPEVHAVVGVVGDPVPPDGFGGGGERLLGEGHALHPVVVTFPLDLGSVHKKPVSFQILTPEPRCVLHSIQLSNLQAIL